MSRANSFVFAAFLALVPALVAAQADQPPSQTTPPPEDGHKPAAFRETIAVTASRIEQPVSAVPTSVIILTSEDIQRSTAQDLDEFLQQVAGFSQLHQSDSHVSNPTTRTAAVRGLGGGNSRTLVLVDGVPLNDPLGGYVYWSRVPLESIDRIEIIKSGASGIWGNLALGGVIHIITKTGNGAQSAVHVRAEGGTSGTGNFSAGAQAGRGPIGAAATAAYYRSDGYFVIPTASAGPIDKAVSDQNLAMTGNVEYQPTSGITWTAGGNFYQERQHAGTPLMLVTTQVGTISSRGSIATAGGSRWQIGGFVTHQNGTTSNSTVAGDRASETPSSNQFDIPATTRAINVQWSKPLSARQSVTIGGDTQFTTTAFAEDFNFTAGRLSRRREANSRQLFGGLYGEHFLQLSRRWHVVASARIDQWNVYRAGRTETDIATENVLRDDHYADRHITTLNPSVGTVVRANRRVSFRGSVYRGFRAPTPTEMYRPFRSRGNVITESNATLNPERLTGTEGGIDIAPATSVQLRVTAFVDYLENAITTRTIGDAGSSTRNIAPCGSVAAGGSCRQRANVGELRSRGVETTLRYRPHPAWGFGVDYVYDPSVVIGSPEQPAIVGLFNKQSPAHQFVIDAAYENPRLFNVSAMVRHVGRSYDDDLNSLSLKAFSTLDVRASRTLMRGAELYILMRNVSNEVIEATKAADGTIGLGTPRLMNAGINIRF